MTTLNPQATIKRSRALTIVTWIVKVLLAFQFLMGGVLKLIGNPVMVEMFADIGSGQGLRYVVGVVEGACAVALLVPRFSGLAALGLVLLMLGATVTRALFLGGAPVLELVFLAFSGFVVARNLSQLKALFTSRKEA
jgi:putative oxidoreductase